MNNQQKLIALIKSMSGQPNILTIPRIYVTLTKSHRAALLLSQCVYWSDRTRDPEGWFYKTFEDWHDELGMPRGAVETAMKHLTPWVQTRLRKAGPTPKTHYRVDMAALALSISDLLESNKSDLSETSISEVPESSKSDLSENNRSSITEITTETTSLGADAPPASPAPRSEKKLIDPIMFEREAALRASARPASPTWLQEHLWPLYGAFVSATQINPFNGDRSYWRKVLGEYYDAGVTPQELSAAAQKALADQVSIKSPESVKYAIYDVRRAQTTPQLDEKTRAAQIGYSGYKVGGYD